MEEAPQHIGVDSGLAGQDQGRPGNAEAAVAIILMMIVS